MMCKITKENGFWSITMLKNYLKISFRNLLKHKGYSAINILGLGIGMACVILILLYVREELSYDQFHKNKHRIFRMNISVTNPQTGIETVRAVGPYRLAKELATDFQDVPALIRFSPQGRHLVEHEDKRYWEEGLAFVDPEVFQVFTFPLIQGDPATALEEPFSVVITPEIAVRYFGDQDPVGRTLTFSERDFEVTGLLKKAPQNSQFQFNMLASMNAGEQIFSRIVLENWGEGYCETYIMLPENTRPQDFEPRFAVFIEVKLSAWRQASPRLLLQPLTELYLHSKDIQTYAAGGDITYVYAFTAIAVFILIIACINFMNLATARSANRAKEVGLRKVVGARRSRLIWQFLSESLLLSILSLVVAVILCLVSLPAFNGITGKNFSVAVFTDFSLILGLLGITLVVGFGAGSYPALFLSALNPVAVLTGAIKRGIKGGWLRRILVTFQFGVSIFLIVATIVVLRQLNYARKIKLGFDKEHLVQIAGVPLTLRQSFDQFRQELLSHPNIINSAGSSRIPPEQLRSSLTVRPEGVPEDQWEGMQTIWTDFDFIETIGLELAAGRSFSRDYSTDGSSAFIINEAAARKFGWTHESAVGKAFGSSEIRDWDKGQWERRNGHIIGVLKDFHFESLHRQIIPTVYFVAPYMAWKYVIRIRSENIPETLDFIEAKWEKIVPSQPLVYQFVDENFDSLYRAEQQQGKIFGVFALLAIFIACLGLVGLASFTAEQRTKEVGIRKVLGASVPKIILMISKEFTLLVLVAFLLASPVAWFVMGGWLQNFSYHVKLGIGIFALTGLVSLCIAWLTVSFQAAKVALTNPAESLRHE